MGPQIGCIVLDGNIDANAWIESIKGLGYVIGSKEKSATGVEYIMFHKKN
jgi:hypothetical protein